MKKIVSRIRNAFRLRDESSEENFDFRLLPDRPIDPDRKEDIRFGHEDIVKTILTLLKKAEPPFTIGLYGKWGTGKTTIAKSVGSLAKGNNFRCLFFDAWKYQKDSLRRQFLIELDNQVFGGKRKYKDILNQALTTPQSLTTGEYFKQITGNIFLRLIGLATIILIIFWGIVLFANPEANFKYVLEALWSFGLLGSLIAFTLASFDVVRGSTYHHRTDSAEGFEAHFKVALQDLEGEPLLVIVDNIDRIENRKAVGVLSDIKTFLSADGDSKSNTLFLIPCDEEALRAQLVAIYGKDFDADEFLRKFFNLTVKIPIFIDLELENYVRDLLQETKVPEFDNNQDLKDVINYALRDSPREIKQFINSLIPLVLLARERQLDTVLEKVAFLAKLLVVRQKHPILYEILEQRALRSSINLDSYDDDYDLGDLYSEGLELKGWKEKAIRKKVDAFNSFNRMTRGINVENIDVFLTLQQSEDERKIPELKSLIVALQEKKNTEAGKLMAAIKMKQKSRELDEILRSWLQKNRKGHMTMNLVSTALGASKKERVDLPGFLNKAVDFFPYEIDLPSVYQDWDPELVFKFWYPVIPASKRERITKPFLNLFKISTGDSPPNTALDNEYAISLLRVINNNPEIFRKYRDEVRESIQSYFYSHPYLSQFKKRDSRELFISETASSKYVDSLSPQELINESEMLRDAIKLWDDLELPKGSVINSFKKFREFLQAMSDAEVEDKLMLCGHIFSFSKKHRGILESDEAATPDLNTEVDAISNSLADYYDRMAEEDRLKIVPLLDFYSRLPRNSNPQVLENKLDNFVEASSNDSLLKMPKTLLKGWFGKRPRPLLERSEQDPEVLIKSGLTRNSDEDQNRAVVMGLITNKKSPKTFLEAVNYKISSPETIIDHAISYIPHVDIPIVEELMQVSRKLGIDSMKDKKESLKNQLIQYKNAHPADKEKLKKIVRKHRKFFNRDQVKELLEGNK